MKQTTNTAATTLEQVNAMPAATWGWLKMNQTKLELSDELAAAPAETVKVEGLDEQFAGVADAFDAAMDAMAERFPERRASAPGDAADRARITPDPYHMGRGQIIIRDEDGVLCGATEKRTDGQIACF